MKKDKLNSKFKNSKTYIIYTILFCIVSFIVFAVFIKNNKSFIWNSDGFSQHFVILYDFNQIIRNAFENGFSMLSWNMGLGLDIIGQYSYYVIGDPFVYISLLFPIEYLETIYSSLIILRIYCIGLAFIAYCNYHKKDRINTLIGAIIYTFCGFILYAGIRHPYFTNAAILLPLNFIGIDKLLREGKKSFFTFIIFVSAISNYYFFYMITIVTIIYAIVKYIFEYNQGWKIFFKKALSAIVCYIIGVLMAGIILLPTIYAFFNSARVEYEQVYAYSPNFYKNFFIGLISMRHNNWTVISMSSIVLLMVPILFTKLKEKEARTFATLFIITTSMLLIPFIASMMNGFSFPSNRWVFAYAFILSYIVTICFDKNLQYSKKQIISMIAILVIYSVIGIGITKLKIKSNLDFYGATAIAIGLLLIIVFNNIKKLSVIKIRKYVNVVVVLLIICNIWGISFALYSKYGKGYVKEFLDNNSAMEQYSTLKGNIRNFEEAVEYIKQNDKEFYRIAKCDIPNQNTSLLYDYHSIQTYVSIGNGSVYNLSNGLEDNRYTATRCVNGMDRRTKITTLLGTKYYICDKEDVQYLPYGYKLYKEIEDTQIYINEIYLSVGTMYDTYILEDDYENLSPLEKEDALLQVAVLEENIQEIEKENYIRNKIDETVEIGYEDKSGLIKNNKINVTKKNQSINLKLDIDKIKSDTEIYFCIKNLKYDSGSTKTNFKITTSFNGIQNNENIEDCLTSAYYVENPNFLMNMGVIRGKTSDELIVTFDNKGVYSFDNLQILAVPMKSYEENVTTLKKNEMKNIVYGNDFISGDVRNDKNGILQITTSYSDGWKVFVDEEERKVIKVNKGFIGTFVEEGEHRIRFEYRTPYIEIGVVCSIIGVIAFLGILISEKRKIEN